MNIKLRKNCPTNIKTIESIYIQFDNEMLKNDENLMLKKFLRVFKISFDYNLINTSVKSVLTLK